MPLFSSSRKPAARTRTFLKELVRIIPDSTLVGRGKQPIDAITEDARQQGYRRVAIVTEMHGNPHSIGIIDVDETGWHWLEGRVVMKSVKLSREFGSRVSHPNGIAVEGKSHFAKALGIEPAESNTIMKETDNAISFFQNGEEVGPRMVLK